MVERNESQQNLEVYKLGEWFAPFQNYEDAASYKSDNGKHEFREFPFEIEGMGSFKGKTVKFLGEGDEMGVILTPAVAIPFTYGELEQHKTRLSARLLDFEIFVKQRLQGLFQLDLKLGEDGSIYTCGFGNWWNSSIASGPWRKEEELVDFLHVPEREYILNQVQTRIVPIPNGTTTAK